VILKRLFGQGKPDPSEALYATIVAAARQEKFYARWQVPDTMDGRFDILILHMFLVLDRLRSFGNESEELRQALTDRFFAAIDAALREVGVGDLAVGKKVRKMAEAFFGRVAAYTAGIEEGDQALREALSRNVFADGDDSHASDLAMWTLNAKRLISTHDLETISTGNVRFE
jgi:cytochrome b pre-mRNA-processing protein 3